MKVQIRTLPTALEPFHWSGAIGNDDTLMLNLLIEHGADIHHREPVLGNSFLTDCAYSNKLKAAKFLIEHGLGPDFPDSLSGESPLIDAISAANISMVSLLLGFGANLNYVSPDIGDRSLILPFFGIGLHKCRVE